MRIRFFVVQQITFAFMSCHSITFDFMSCHSIFAFLYLVYIWFPYFVIIIFFISLSYIFSFLLFSQFDECLIFSLINESFSLTKILGLIFKKLIQTSLSFLYTKKKNPELIFFSYQNFRL